MTNSIRNRWRSTLPKAPAHSWLLLAVSCIALLLPACEGGGHFTVGGYTTLPNYDPSIQTVYVPIFENRTFRRGIEFDLTKAVIREIEAKTPFKVVSNCETADTELKGTIIAVSKMLLNRNQLNEMREGERVLAVQLIWRDRRTGEILSASARRAADAPAPLAPPDIPGLAMPGPTPPVSAPTPPQPVAVAAADNAPPVPAPGGPIVGPIPPVLVIAQGHFIPELGESITTAEKKAIDRLATQIVSMMESPW